MTKYEFWRTWKRKTRTEKQAIKSVRITKRHILRAIPRDKLVAIYIKGSFARREMKKGSDVDIVPIVTENKYQKKIFEVNKPEIQPSIVVPLSLWELENNKLYTKSNTPRARPDRFIRMLKEHKLIYGQPLDVTKFKVRTDEESLNALAKTFTKSFVPLYRKGKLKFSVLVKELFWLVELEQTVKGKNPLHSFKGISKSIKDPRHLIHHAYRLRLKPSKDAGERKRFIQGLEKYLWHLEKTLS